MIIVTIVSVLYVWTGYEFLCLFADLKEAYSGETANFSWWMSTIFVIFWPVVMLASRVRDLLERGGL